MKINLEIIKLLFEIFIRIFQLVLMFVVLLCIIEFVWNGQYVSITNLDTGKETTIVFNGYRNLIFKN